jgi:hypothetical protein
MPNPQSFRTRRTRRLALAAAVALAAAMAALLFALANPAPAASTLVNGDFETGDTAGWTVNNPVNTQVVTGYGSYQPVHGNHFVLLTADQANTPVKISQSFFAGMGMTVRGDTFFKAGDYLPYNDSGQVVVKIKENGTTVATPFNKSISDVGDYGQTPWTHWEHTFAEPGDYTIELSVTNALDSLNDSVIGLDAVELSYAFKGFFSPVDNPEVLNNVKAGSAIPVKFSLDGDMGLDVLATGSPNSQSIDCDSSDPVDAIEETVTAGSSSLSYDATTDQYTYVWKTNKAWANTCRQLGVTLNDGSTHLANFKFVR